MEPGSGSDFALALALVFGLAVDDAAAGAAVGLGAMGAGRMFVFVLTGGVAGRMGCGALAFETAAGWGGGGDWT